MSPEELLVPIIIVSTLVAILVFVMFFLTSKKQGDPAVTAVPDESAPDESDSWYFVRFEPTVALRDLSHP
jgi:hypothetical protein